jgi:hypothetical protein
MDETPPNEYWSMSQASRTLGINKGIISQDVSKGKIQWHARPDGTKKLFVPELYNVYSDKLAKKRKQLENGDKPLNGTENKLQENRELTVIVEAKDEVITLLKSQIEGLRGDLIDTRQDRDHWRRQAEQATDILKALPAPANHNAEPSKERRLNLWQRLTGARG